jgi:hypothetical protein
VHDTHKVGCSTPTYANPLDQHLRGRSGRSTGTQLAPTTQTRTEGRTDLWKAGSGRAVVDGPVRTGPSKTLILSAPGACNRQQRTLGGALSSVTKSRVYRTEAQEQA